ncbi:MAG: histidine kinase, partial [Flavobacterium sp.]
PILIQLNKNATLKDSLIVRDFMVKLKTLIPSIQIAFDFDKKISSPFHYVDLGFGKKSFPLKNYFIKRELPDQTTIYRSREGYITISDGSESSSLDFDFNDTITDEYRKVYIEQELLTAIFSTNATRKPYNSQFPVGIFNNSDYSLDYGYLGGADEFLLKKVYAKDFENQFSNYLYANYPWQYATAFLNKKLATFYSLIIVGSIGSLVFMLLFGLFQNKKFKYSYLNYFIPILCIWIYYANLNFVYRFLTDFNALIDWKDIIIFGLIIVFIIALICSFLLWGLEKIFIKENSVFSLQLILKTVFTFLAFSLTITAIFIFDEHTDEGINFFLPSFLIFIAFALGRGLLLYLNHYSDSLVKEKDVELSRLKEVNAQSELKLLQSHINPHFLYNALNSIAGLAHNDPEKTEKMALSLSNLFRYSINKKGQKMSTVKEEVLMVENYLEIEKIRFGKRLKFTLQIEEAVENEPIPMYILQPLVENAIKHGISEIRGEGFITLEIKKEIETLFISVSDNGPDFPSSLVSGHGLQTVYDLLRLSYGEKAALKWENSPKKQIVISITQTV